MVTQRIKAATSKVKNQTVKKSIVSIPTNKLQEAIPDLLVKLYLKRIQVQETPNDVIIMRTVLYYLWNNSADHIPYNQWSTIIEKSKSTTYDFTDELPLLMFCIVLFLDQLHDLKEGTKHEKKSAGTMITKSTPKTTPGAPAPPLPDKLSKAVYVDQTFENWVNLQVWMNQSIRTEIIRIYKLPEAKEYKDFLSDSLGKLKSWNNTINEKSIFEALITNKNGILHKLNDTGVPGKLKYDILQGFPTNNTNESETYEPWMVFDMSSKASGPAALARSTTSSSTDERLVKRTLSKLGYGIIIDLPILADKGSQMPSSPVGTFFKKLRNLFTTYKKNKILTVSDMDTMIEFVFLPNITVTNSFTYKGAEWFTANMVISPYNYDIHLQFVLNGVGVTDFEHPIASASQMATAQDSGGFIFKSWGDISLLLEAIATGGTAVTGDTMAGVFYSFMNAMYQNNGIIISDNKVPYFIFEFKPTQVLCTSNFTLSPPASVNGSANFRTQWRPTGINKSTPKKILNYTKKYGIVDDDELNDENLKGKLFRFKELLDRFPKMLLNFFSIMGALDLQNNSNFDEHTFKFINRANAVYRIYPGIDTTTGGCYTGS